VAQLLELKGAVDGRAQIVNRLEAVASKQGWQPQLEECKKHAFFDWDEGRAVLIQAGSIQYVVALLRSRTHTIPGADVQTLILLNKQGKYLDHLACEINSRLSSMHSGKFHTVIPTNPEPDGAHLVIRLDGVSARGNFAHDVHHGGRNAEFYWGHERLPDDQPTKWDTNGLCRICIKDGKFQVLFPSEKDMEQRGVPDPG
jgi:hypothetical protein